MSVRKVYLLYMYAFSPKTGKQGTFVYTALVSIVWKNKYMYMQNSQIQACQYVVPAYMYMYLTKFRSSPYYLGEHRSSGYKLLLKLVFQNNLIEINLPLYSISEMSMTDDPPSTERDRDLPVLSLLPLTWPAP